MHCIEPLVLIVCKEKLTSGSIAMAALLVGFALFWVTLVRGCYRRPVSSVDKARDY